MGITSKVLRNEGLFRNTGKYVRQKLRGHRVSAPPIFLVGCGHSGTSILQRLLGEHSHIYGVPYESRIFEYENFKKWLTMKIWNRETVVRAKQRWVEKTPMHVRLIERIFASFPTARILFVVRDGRDVTVSFRKRFGDFETGLKRWVEDNRSGLAWRDDSRVMTVRYEDLVKRYDETMPRICAFIGETFEEGMIAFHENPAYYHSEKVIDNPVSESGKDHKYYRNWQVNQKLFDGSGKWVKEMSEEEKARFKTDKDAMELLIEFGYADGDDW